MIQEPLRDALVRKIETLPKLRLWDKFFEDVNQFNFDNQPRFPRPQFLQDNAIVDEEDVRGAFKENFCKVLNKLLEDYNFSRLPTPTSGIPDFTCHYAIIELILAIEIERKHVIGNLNNKTYIDHCKSDKDARNRFITIW
jgi:hypothetical protein